MVSRWVFLIPGMALLIAGCHRPSDGPGDGVQVIVEGERPFPESLAGRWQADQHGWELVLEPDGRLSAAVISLGRVPVVPGRTTTVPTRNGSDAVFTPGTWTVHYVPDTRELTVKIAMDHVRLEMGGNLLEGSSTDVFAGPVSAAADAWHAQWTSFTRYTARTPDSASFDLWADPQYGETRPLVFRKTPDPAP